MSAARLNKQRQELQKAGYQVIAQNDTMWLIILAGPKQTPFEGGQFELQFKFQNFPFKGPIVKCRTKIYHPNVSEVGQLCKDMIDVGDKWAPTKKLVSVIEKIFSLFIAPNLETPLNQQAAKDYKDGKWQAKAKQFTQQHAKIK